MILWIDPGVRKLGYALIDQQLKIIDSGILLQKKTEVSRQDQFERMLQISDFFEKLLGQYPIKVLSIEKLFFTNQNQNNAEFVFGIRAILIQLALKHHLEILEFSPIELKKYITGNGKADKLLVQKMTMRLFNLAQQPEYNDAADALGLAYLGFKLFKTKKEQ